MKQDMLKYLKELKLRTKNHMGYPYNLQPSFTKLTPFLEYSINNLGDPFVQSNYRIASRNYEQLTLDWFSELWKFKNYWGYITSCGTEGNLHSLYVARENLGKKAILLASDQSHYSILKAARMFCLDYKILKTNYSGEICYSHLQETLSTMKKEHIILNLNLGSTVKGAIDNVDKVISILNDLNISREKIYIHGDAALFGMMLPFLEKNNLGEKIDAIATSGHKFLGIPFPCGILMMQNKHITVLENTIEYLNSTDTTMMGSRNGHAPLFMWHRIKEHKLEGFKKDVLRCIKNAKLLHTLLSKYNITSHVNENSNIVFFTKPKCNKFINKWQLACEGEIAHVVVMPNIDARKIIEFIEELNKL